MLKKSVFILTALASLTMAILPNLRAANQANDNGSAYQNPWGPVNPQSRTTTGFAPWVFDHWNPPTQNPAKTPFFIDTAKGAWGINVPADIQGQTGYDAAYISFTGDGYLDQNQTFSTIVVFTNPGTYSPTETPTEGIDFFAQNVPAEATRYANLGHQVLGLYLGPTPSGPSLSLAVHTTLSDESPSVWTKIAIPGSDFTSANPFNITFKSLAGGNWNLTLQYNAQYTQTFTYTYWQSQTFGGHWATGYYTYSYSIPRYIFLTSGQYGTTWNKAPTQGVDAVRYFTSQGGVNPGGPLTWTNMWVQ